LFIAVVVTWVIAFKSGFSETEFKDVDPWREPEGASGDIVRQEPPARISSGVKERVLKMSAHRPAGRVRVVATGCIRGGQMVSEFHSDYGGSSG